MADIGYSVSREEIDPSSFANFDPIPEGDYEFLIIEADVVDTKDSTGKMLTFTAEVMDGEMKGRKVWGRLNIVNKSAQAQKIGREQLSKLVLATAIDGAFSNSDQLLHQTFWGRVKLRTYKGNDGSDKVSNEFKDFLFDPGQAATPPAVKPAAEPMVKHPAKAAAPATSATKAPPWKRAAA